MRRVSRAAIAAVMAVLGGLVLWAMPTVAASPPSAVWVGTATAVPGGTSCAHPGFNSVQAAVNAVASGGTVTICTGTYVGQVEITKSVNVVGQGSPTLQLPTVPVNSGTVCDTAIPSPPFQPNQNEVSVCGAITVNLTGVVVQAAWPTGTCYDSMYGVFVGGGATLKFSNSSVTAAGAQPINGCQGGIGIQVGTTRSTPTQVGHLVASNSSISGYQKNGVNVVGVGSTGSFSNVVVTGAGATNQIAQNGVEVAFGGQAAINGGTISGNECDHPSCGPNGLTDTQSAGILLYGAAPGTTVTGVTISGNDIGVYYLADPAGPAPTKSTASITGNKLVNNRYEGIVLDQGIAALSSNTYSGGNVGLQALQYFGQTFGGHSTATGENFKGQTVAAVQVLSDQNPGDQPGTLTLKACQLNGEPVLDNSTNYPVLVQ